MWCMAYDMDVLQNRRMRSAVLGEIADAGHLALFTHDPEIVAARLQRDRRDDFRVTETSRDLQS